MRVRALALSLTYPSPVFSLFPSDQTGSAELKGVSTLEELGRQPPLTHYTWAPSAEGWSLDRVRSKGGRTGGRVGTKGKWGRKEDAEREIQRWDKQGRKKRFSKHLVVCIVLD